MNPIPSQTNELQDIFKTQLKVDAKVMAIETLFANKRRASKTDYAPSYQRNYVWDDDKATYFIESILLGTEIPPIIFFNSDDKIEVIDGRQRYETIKRFIEKTLKLKKGGLFKLTDLKNKNFDELGDLRDIFWDTKLRIIEFSFRDQSLASKEKEDLVKMEIFKRYNSGITPLKSVDIDKAKYQENEINSYFKNRIKNNLPLIQSYSDLFSLEEPVDIEKILKKIRFQLSLPQIPVKYYFNTKAKQETISRFFEYLSTSVEDIEEFYVSFQKKLSILKILKSYFEENNFPDNRLVFECLFWGLSIIEKENKTLEIIIEKNSKKNLLQELKKELSSFDTQEGNIYGKAIVRYEIIAKILHKMYGVNFDIYLQNNQIFNQKNKELSQVVTDVSELAKFESLRLNKPDASSTTIDDICARMSKERFLIRPPYQRKEVIDRTKSSSIIESILLGIRIPPVFLFKRSDGIAEVLDGQQRLLSILGYLGKSFIDQDKMTALSEKNEFGLKKLNILKDMEGRTFNQLPVSYQDKILDSDLWIVEINEKSNVSFDPIDLFIRLNYKPFPILENTFEMWNSYVDRDIIYTIKDIDSNYNKWFYLRVDNRRMENESMITYLCFLEFGCHNEKGRKEVPVNFFIFNVSKKTSIRINYKNQITSVLDDPKNKENFLKSCKELENNLILKLKELLSNDDHADSEVLRSELDLLLGVNKVRTFQNFYAIWYILLNIPIEAVKENKTNLKQEIRLLIKEMRLIEDVEKFKERVRSLQNKYS